MIWGDNIGRGCNISRGGNLDRAEPDCNVVTNQRTSWLHPAMLHDFLMKYQTLPSHFFPGVNRIKLTCVSKLSYREEKRMRMILHGRTRSLYHQKHRHFSLRL